jgi:hypothetical protein
VCDLGRLPEVVPEDQSILAWTLRYGLQAGVEAGSYLPAPLMRDLFSRNFAMSRNFAISIRVYRDSPVGATFLGDDVA